MALIADPYELLVRSVVDYAIYMLGPDGYVVSWNPGAERIKGYTGDEIIGQHFSRFYTEEERAAGKPEAALRTAGETGRFSAEGWRVRKNGSRFWALVVIDAIRDEGNLIGFAKITRDITEQHNTQLALLEAERKFRLLVQSVTDYAIFMLDLEGRVANWNIGAERIKGYTAAEIVGQHFSRFYTPEDFTAGLPSVALERARAEGRSESEGWRCRKDGTRFWANAVIDAVRDEDGKLIGFAKITRDLTERRESERHLEQSREQLFQAQKMEAVGQLTGGLAHDFNNLLTGIMGSLELAATRIQQGRTEDTGRYIDIAQSAASRAAALTHRLLAFSRRQALDAKATDVNTLVAEMEELIRRTVGPEITVETGLAAGLWKAKCDPNQLENAILNLCINSRDAMPEGGKLRIETANAEFDQFEARQRIIPAGQYVLLSVSDTGMGMPPEVRDRVFEPFFTTKPTGQGTGLGLSMVYGFVKQSGGEARIDSTVGAGTIVRLYLPRDDGEEIAEEASPDSPRIPHARGVHTVLVVDDESSIRTLVGEVLTEFGYTVIEAIDGPAGLKALQTNPQIDLLITDVGLPGGVNGRQLAEMARQSRPTLKVLFITAYAMNAATDTEQLAPGMHILIKPFTLDAIAERIRAIIGEG